MVVGDSIAVGTAVYRPECVSYSRGGWNSWQWNRDYLDIANQKKYNTVIISLGSNDHDGVHTFKELMKMRQNIQGARVFWIMPAVKPNIQEMIKIIADNYKDTILPIKELSKDGIHPTTNGYKTLAKDSK
jgi:hypothetical protein